MKTLTRRPPAPKRHGDTEQEKRPYSQEDFLRMHERARQMFQDAERMYHDVQEHWNKRHSAPTAPSSHEPVS